MSQPVAELNLVGGGFADPLAGVVSEIVERLLCQRCRFFADADKFGLELCTLLYRRIRRTLSVGELFCDDGQLCDGGHASGGSRHPVNTGRCSQSAGGGRSQLQAATLLVVPQRIQDRIANLSHYRGVDQLIVGRRLRSWWLMSQCCGHFLEPLPVRPHAFSRDRISDAA